MPKRKTAADDKTPGDQKRAKIHQKDGQTRTQVSIKNGEIMVEDVSVTSKDSKETSEDLNVAQTPPTLMTEASDATTTQAKRPSDMKTIPCTIPNCGKMFNRQARLEAHLRSHNGERPFKCHYEGCDKAYTDNKYLRSHIDSAHLKLPKFVCGQCGQGFATGQRLERHGDVHAGAERFRCRDYPPCDQTFRKRKTLDRHVLKDHLGKKPFRCEEEGCGDSYATLNALKAHTQREHGEEKYICGPCTDKVMKDPTLRNKIECGFTTKVQLEAHIRHMHLNCVYCGDGVAFAGQYELERHIDLKHTTQTVKDRKTVKCDMDGCEKRFVKRSNMLTHFRTAHEGLRFTCGKVDTSEIAGLENWDWKTKGCGQRFTSKVGATEHALYIHLGAQRPEYVPTHPPNARTEYSFLDEVSGVTDLERRPIACTASGCRARFVRYADMHAHVATDHSAVAGSSQMPQTHDRHGFDGQEGQIFRQQGPAYSSPAAGLSQTTLVPHFDGQYAQTFGQSNLNMGQCSEAFGQQNRVSNQEVKQEEIDIMQLVDFDPAIDPQLLAG